MTLKYRNQEFEVDPKDVKLRKSTNHLAAFFIGGKRVEVSISKAKYESILAITSALEQGLITEAPDSVVAGERLITNLSIVPKHDVTCFEGGESVPDFPSDTYFNREDFQKEVVAKLVDEEEPLYFVTCYRKSDGAFVSRSDVGKTLKEAETYCESWDYAWPNFKYMPEKGPFDHETMLIMRCSDMTDSGGWQVVKKEVSPKPEGAGLYPQADDERQAEIDSPWVFVPKERKRWSPLAQAIFIGLVAFVSPLVFYVVYEFIKGRLP